MLKDLDGGVWKTRIAEPQRKSFSRWHGDTEARDTVYANRSRLRSAVGKTGMRKRAELVERSFAQIWTSRHAPNVAPRAGERPQALPDPRRRPQPRNPDAPADRRRNAKEAAGRGKLLLLVVQMAELAVFVILAIDEAGLGILVVIVSTDPA